MSALRFVGITVRWFLGACLVVAAVREARSDDPPPSPAPSPEKSSPEKLPWEVTRKPPNLPGRRFENAKEFLELLGVDASQWNNLRSDVPLSPADEEWIDRILFHLPRIGGENFFRWRCVPPSVTELAAKPARYQGSVFLLKGRAVAADRVNILPELVDRYEYDHYFRVRIELADGGEAIVCTRSVPSAWRGREKLNDRVSAEAIFLKLSPREEQPPELVFIAPRVAWLPETGDVSSEAPPESAKLADYGFDAGLWDAVAGRSMRPLQESDREPFYHLLGAVKEMSPKEPLLLSASRIDIAASIRSPDAQLGRAVEVQGMVHRIDRVEVTDPEMQARFGLKHYYTLFVFVPLRNEKIVWARKPGDPNPRVFENQFPVTLCTTELPPGLAPSPSLHENIRASGIYYKVWTYRPAGQGADLLQPSPLVVAPAVSIVEMQPPSDPRTNLILGGVFGVLICVLAVVAWRVRRADRQFRKEVFEKKVLGTDQVDLTKLG
jgi:hypothetical protein